MYAADLAYLNCLDDYDDITYREVPEYAVPVFRVEHPWNKLSNADPTVLCSDFILVAEFSELEGPRPLITIPKDGAGNFNLNDFAVRIMSVDQNTSVSEGFHMTEDFQVIMTETRDNVYAFVHHFVLYDQQARGYVRPFAVGYVTADQRKLMYFYEEITSQMKKVARYFKYGNKMVFRNDLERYLKDVEFTKRHIWKDYSLVENGDAVMNKIKQLGTMAAEVQNILSIIKPMLNDRRMEQRFARMEEKAKVNKHRTKLDSVSLKEWEHLDHLDFPTSGSLGNKEETITVSVDFDKYKPKLVTLGGKRKFDIHLRGLHELCSWGAKDGLQKLRHIHQHFQRDMAVLQTEKMDVKYTEPSSGLLTFGNQCLAANFMANIDKICVGSICCRLVTHRSDTPKFLRQRCPSNDTLESFQSLSSSFQSIPDYDSYDNISMASASSDVPVTPRNCKEMEDSCQTLVPDGEFYLGDDLCVDNINDEIDSGLHVNGSSSSDEATESKSELCAIDKSVICKNAVNDGSHEPLVVCDNCRINIMENKSVLKTFQGSSTCDKNQFFLSYSDTDLINQSLKRFKIENSNDNLSKSPKLNVIEYEIKTCQKCLLQFPQMMEEGDSSASNGEDTLHQPISEKAYSNFEIFPEYEDDFDSFSPGYGLKKLFTSYNNLQPVIYSLLIGRCVFIVGTADHEADIKCCVKALRIFLTTYHRKPHSCVLWTTSVPRLLDLSKLKLVGLCRPERKPLDRLVPNAIKKVVTIMDVEKRMIYSPSYQGAFINTVLAKKKVFRAEDAFLSFVQSCLLDISSKAFIYFHSFCLGTASTYASGYTMPKQSESYRSTISTFLSKLGVHDCDVSIVEYLAEVIKFQHIEDFYQTDTKSGMPVRPIHVNYQPCQTFKC